MRLHVSFGRISRQVRLDLKVCLITLTLASFQQFNLRGDGFDQFIQRITPNRQLTHQFAHAANNFHPIDDSPLSNFGRNAASRSHLQQMRPRDVFAMPGHAGGMLAAWAKAVRQIKRGRQLPQALLVQAIGKVAAVVVAVVHQYIEDAALKGFQHLALVAGDAQRCEQDGFVVQRWQAVVRLQIRRQAHDVDTADLLAVYQTVNARTGHLSSGLPLRGSATPWLVKFPAEGEHREVCAIEELYARVARSGDRKSVV